MGEAKGERVAIERNEKWEVKILLGQPGGREVGKHTLALSLLNRRGERSPKMREQDKRRSAIPSSGQEWKLRHWGQCQDHTANQAVLAQNLNPLINS